MPVIYEVNIDVHPSIAEAYVEWLRPHIEEMYHQIHGLRSARLCRREPRLDYPADTPVLPDATWVGYTVTYEILSRDALDDYLANRSGPMRQSALDTFGTGKFVAFRRIMDVLEEAAC